MGRTQRARRAAVELGARVRREREATGLSQLRFAERVGLHFTYISDVERGRRNVSLDTIVRLAAALDVDAGDLVRGLVPGDEP